MCQRNWLSCSAAAHRAQEVNQPATMRSSTDATSSSRIPALFLARIQKRCGTPVPWILLLLLIVKTTTAWTVHSPHLVVMIEHRRRRHTTSRSLLWAADLPSNDHSPGSSSLWLGNDDDDADESLITTGLLKISYDGASFSGWTVGDDNSAVTARSVRGVLQANLAKLYGNVDPSRIIVEGCSRTDKGVHAIGMVAQFYCLIENYEAARVDWWYPPGQPSIPGRRTPHPRNATDTSCFVPLARRGRHQQDALAQLVYSLNRMCPADVQIMAYASIPSTSLNNYNNNVPFHPTRSAHRTTYRYHFSVGVLHDPTQIHTAWHIGSSSDDDIFNCGLIQQACAILQGRHNFTAFRGAPRGPQDKRKFLHQDPFCTLEHVSLQQRPADSWFVGALALDRAPTRTAMTYTLEITGDRFLYKMVRFLVGALVAVGRQRMSLTALEGLVTTGDRGGLSWDCAPAHGLQLYDVHYSDITMEWQTGSR